MGRSSIAKTRRDSQKTIASNDPSTVKEPSIMDEKERYESRRRSCRKQKDDGKDSVVVDLEKQEGKDEALQLSGTVEAGAYRVGDGGSEERVNQLSAVEPDSIFVSAGALSGAAPPPTNGDVYESTVQAELVKEPPAAILAISVPEGGDEEISELRSEVTRNSRQNRRLLIALVIVVLLAIVVGVTVAVVLTRNNGNVTPTASSVPSPSPTMNPTLPLAPTTFSNLIATASPTSTIEDPASPAGKAFNWLENDGYSNQVLQDLNFNSVIQRFALAVLFYATNGETDWPELKRGWLNDASECVSWNVADLQCDENFEIADIALGRADGVGGTLPSEISLLTALTSLDLSRNDIAGTIPATLGTLTKLQGLRLFENDFVGSLPDDIVLLTEMRHLAVTLNSLTGTIPAIGGMSKLTFLDVRDNLFDGPLAGLEGMDSLAFLYMFNLNVSGTLPTSLCDTLQDAWIDCGEVNCDCCTARYGEQCP